MLYLILCIIFNAAIFICFKLFSRSSIPILPAIVINYCICVITGAFYSGEDLLISIQGGFTPWMYFAIGLGLIFLATFYLMAYITHKFSISVSTISSKISLVIPVLFSLFILKTRLLDYDFFNYLGIAGAIAAIVFSSWKDKKIKHTNLSQNDLGLPFLLFFLNGLIDTTINYVSNRYLNERDESVFPILVFLTAAVAGVAILLFNKTRITNKILVGGLALGIINYFAVYTLVKALSAHDDDGAFVYPVLNLGIIILASSVSMLFFHERFSRLNWAGFILAILSLILLSHQSLLG